MIYKKLVNGKLYATNNQGVIEILTQEEMQKKANETWLQRNFGKITAKAAAYKRGQNS